ncbi:MAG: hypothetical protein IJO23_07315 [Bacteroidales bacterium]|nr:hypothetical protein [Bacteroidales bacterium]
MAGLAMILLGNGFDIALGAKTKYSDFAKSEQFQSLLSDNELAKYIWKKFEMQDMKWVDVELELANYSQYLSAKYGDSVPEEVTKQFKVDYEVLNKQLSSYISRCFYFNGDGKIDSVIHDWYSLIISEDLDVRIYTLNYLPGEYRSFDFLNYTDDKTHLPNHIHGQVSFNPNDEPKIVFGVDEACNLSCKEHGFLYKSRNENLALNGFNEIAEDAGIFIIYGSSLGITDRWYFQKIFKGKKDCRFKIYYYTDNELPRMKEAISEIVGDYREFLSHNDVDFIKISN